MLLTKMFFFSLKAPKF